jgi:hypothetical protein
MMPFPPVTTGLTNPLKTLDLADQLNDNNRNETRRCQQDAHSGNRCTKVGTQILTLRIDSNQDRIRR